MSSFLVVQFASRQSGEEKKEYEDRKKLYISSIQKWDFDKITKFVNTVVEGVVKGDIIILNVDKIIIDKLMKKIKDRNYTDVREWFKDKIRDELNE